MMRIIRRTLRRDSHKSLMDMTKGQLASELLRLIDCVSRLSAKQREAENRLAESREPIAGTCACQRCGRRDGLDAVAANEVWERISKAADGANLLCLWCMDEIAGQLGIKASASLHFAGRALHGTSQSDADRGHVARLTAKLAEAEATADTIGRLHREDACRLQDAMAELARLRAVVEAVTVIKGWSWHDCCEKARAALAALDGVEPRPTPSPNSPQISTHQPRPEHVVKAEALRKAADHLKQLDTRTSGQYFMRCLYSMADDAEKPTNPT